MLSQLFLLQINDNDIIIIFNLSLPYSITGVLLDSILKNILCMRNIIWCCYCIFDYVGHKTFWGEVNKIFCIYWVNTFTYYFFFHVLMSFCSFWNNLLTINNSRSLYLIHQPDILNTYTTDVTYNSIFNCIMINPPVFNIVVYTRLFSDYSCWCYPKLYLGNIYHWLDFPNIPFWRQLFFHTVWLRV